MHEAPHVADAHSAAPLALASAKAAINRGQDLELAPALQWEQACYEELLPTEDRREALSAFADKVRGATCPYSGSPLTRRAAEGSCVPWSLDCIRLALLIHVTTVSSLPPRAPA